MQEAICVEQLGKRFSRHAPDRPHTIMEMALSGWRRTRPGGHFWALRDVTFSVNPGEMLGILGHNGAGKSTLLRLLGGIGQPDEGRIWTNGRIGALLELGAGFHPDLTGRENAFVAGIAAGLTQKELQQRFDEIVAFAELESFIDSPLRTYSTGMQMRLAFAIAVHTNPQIILVDEVITVGDLAFQAKCLDRIQRLKEDGAAIVLISQSPEQISSICNHALWLRQGQVVGYGEPEVVAGQYRTEMRSQSQQRTPNMPNQMASSGIELRVNENRFGSQEVSIRDVVITPTDPLAPGDALEVQIHYEAQAPIELPIVGVSISQHDGQVCLDTNTAIAQACTGTFEKNGCITLKIQRLDLVPGDYFVDVGIYEKSWAYAYDYHWHVYPLQIEGPCQESGVLRPPMEWILKKEVSVR